MNTRYELYYKTKKGGKVFCGDYHDEATAKEDMRIMQSWFPKETYWIEPYKSHKED